MERSYPPLPGRFLLNAVGAVAMALLALIVLPIFGSAVVGLVLVALAGGQETGAEGLLWLARIAFGAAILVAGTGLSVWWQTRRRSVLGVALAAVTAIASAATYVLLLVSDLPTMPWLSILVLGAGALGLVDLVLELVSRPEGGGKEPEATAAWATKLGQATAGRRRTRPPSRRTHPSSSGRRR
ncbi:hypothetical protein [Nocardioides sp. NPDC006303]|uniref:hypothetical protein n=1 Tax=Nocardioides sp. NPDC006303 TaxID=3156747 RepID=UPI0033B2155A